MCGSPRARTVQSHASCSHRALRARADIHRRAAPTDGTHDWTACSCWTSGHAHTLPRASPPLTPTASHCLQTAVRRTHIRLHIGPCADNPNLGGSGLDISGSDEGSGAVGTLTVTLHALGALRLATGAVAAACAGVGRGRAQAGGRGG